MKISAMVSKVLRGPVSVLKIRNREIILSDAALHLYNILQKYLLRFKTYRPDMNLTKYFKGEQFRKTAGGAMVLNLSTLCDNALYLYQVFRKCPK